MKMPEELMAFLNLDKNVVFAIPFVSELCRAGPEERYRMRTTILEARNHSAHSGTTVVAFSYLNGVVMAADRQATIGWGKSLEAVKLFQVSSHSVVGMAGTVSCIQETTDVLRDLIKQYELFLEKDLFVCAHGKLLERILKSNFFGFGLIAELLGYVALPLLGGVDPNPDLPIGRIYAYDGAGAICDVVNQVCKYETVGSGGVVARTVLDRKWAARLPRKEAIHLAIEAIYAAGMRDINSGPAQVAAPSVVLVTTSGVEWITEGQAMLITSMICTEDMNRRGVIFSSPESKEEARS